MSNKPSMFVFVVFLAVILSACSTSTYTHISTAQPQPTSNTPKYNLLGTQGKSHYVVIDKELDLDRKALSSIADEVCKDQTICIVYFWDDNSKAASSLPMTDEQLNAKVAQYNLNNITGFNRLLICASDGC